MRVALPESSPGGARRQLRASLVARRRSVPARERQRASLLVARNVDRALPLRSRWRSAWYAPRLVGLAYGFQQLEHITAAAHDVLMDAVVTEEGIIRCATG